MRGDSDKNLINCFTDNQYHPSRPLAPKESDKSYLFSTLLLRIEMRHVQNQAGVISPPCGLLSPRTTANMAYQQHLILKIFSQADKSRGSGQRSEGVSLYRANISMLRRCLSDWFCTVLERYAHRHARLWSGQWQCFGQNRLVWWRKMEK